MTENQEETATKRKYTAGKCVADRDFPSDIYMPEREIVYNDELNAEILRVLVMDPVHYSKVFMNGKTASHGDYQYLYEYIIECTRHMPKDKFKLSFRIFWVLNKWQDFPKCTICGKRLILDNENLGFRLKLNPDGSLFYKWPRTCCSEHAQLDETARLNYVNTCMDRYGYANTFQVPEYKEKAVAKHEARYGKGITSPAKSPIVQAQMQTTCFKNHGVSNPFKSKEIREKAMREYKENTGYDSPQKNPETWIKSNERQMAERGYTHIQMRNKAPGYKKNILNNEYDEPLFSLEEFVKTDNHNVPLKFRCKKCGKTFESIHVRTHNRCPDCYPEDQLDGPPPSYLSSLNRRMFKALDALNIEYEKEFTIRFDIQDNDHTYRRYDVKVGNIIVELNGDYWHARPGFIYNGKPITADTVLKYHSATEYTAQEIWDYDKEKADLARSHCYEFVTLWETEMNAMTDDELKSWVCKNVLKLPEKS